MDLKSIKEFIKTKESRTKNKEKEQRRKSQEERTRKKEKESRKHTGIVLMFGLLEVLRA